MYRYNGTTITDITTNFTFTDVTLSKSLGTQSTSETTVTVTDSTFNENADLTYKVKANIFNSSTESYSGVTSVGPLSFNCYNATTTGNNVNFTNNIALTQSDGSALPDWMTFNESTAMITVSNTSDVPATIYTMTNSYTGILGNFTLVNNVSITFTEVVQNNTTNNTNSNNTNPNNTNLNNTNTNNTNTNSTNTNNTNTNNGTNNQNEDDDHCLGASSEALCGVFMSIIVVAALAFIICIGVVLYCKLKKKPENDRIRVDQQDVNESQCNQDDDVPTPGQQQANIPYVQENNIYTITRVRENQA